MRPWNALLPLLALGLLAGCESTRDRNPFSNSSTKTGSTAYGSTSTSGSAASASKSTSGQRSGAIAAAAPRTSSKPSSTTLVAGASAAFPTGDPATSALLVERFAPRQVRLGETFEMETVVHNLTGMPLENVVVSETIDPNFRFEASVPPVSATAGGMRTFSLGTLAAGAEKRIRITGSALKATDVSSCVSASYNSAVCLNVPVVQPALELVAKGTSAALACDEIKYEYVLRNTGTGDTGEITFDPKLPAGLVGEKGLAVKPVKIANLAPGASKTLMYTLKAERTGAFQSIASASAGTLQAGATALSTTVTQPRLTIAATGTEQAFAGRDMSYTFTVTNTGDGPSGDTLLQIPMSSSAKLKMSEPTARVDKGVASFGLGTLAPGQNRQVTLRMSSEDFGTVVLRGKAMGHCADPVEASVSTEVTGMPAILMEVVDAIDPILVGDDETYTLVLTNQGTAPAKDLRVVITLPDEVSLVRITGATTPDPSSIQGRRITLPALGNLDPKDEATWKIIVRGDKPGDTRLRVSVTRAGSQIPIEETEATIYYQ